MDKRFNINAITSYEDKDGNTRKSYARCGTAFLKTTQNGDEVINLLFDFIPTAAAGKKLEIACFEPKAKDDDNGDVTE